MASKGPTPRGEEGVEERRAFFAPAKNRTDSEKEKRGSLGRRLFRNGGISLYLAKTHFLSSPSPPFPIHFA